MGRWGRRSVLVLLVSVALLAGLVVELHSAVSSSRRLTGLTRREREAVSTLAQTLDGLIVWSSNRSGDHELYLLDLRGPAVRRLTHDTHVDFFPRVSPDGQRIVFLR